MPELFICEECGHSIPIVEDGVIQTIAAMDLGEGVMRWCVECEPPADSIEEAMDRATRLAEKSLREMLERPVMFRVLTKCHVCDTEQQHVLTAMIDDPLDYPLECSNCGVKACYAVRLGDEEDT